MQSQSRCSHSHREEQSHDEHLTLAHNVLAQAGRPEELGQTARRIPALPAANGSATYQRISFLIFANASFISASTFLGSP
jgi:hypothetical protein